MKQTSKCCERCFGSISGLQWWCNDTSCPCHSPVLEEKKKSLKNTQGITYEELGVCVNDCAFDSGIHLDREHCGRLPTQESMDWEEALYFDVMEDFLHCVEWAVRYEVKDKEKYYGELREYYEKLKQVVGNQIKQAEERVKDITVRDVYAFEAGQKDGIISERERIVKEIEENYIDEIVLTDKNSNINYSSICYKKYRKGASLKDIITLINQKH